MTISALGVPAFSGRNNRLAILKNQQNGRSRIYNLRKQEEAQQPQNILKKKIENLRHERNMLLKEINGLTIQSESHRDYAGRMWDARAYVAGRQFDDIARKIDELIEEKQVKLQKIEQELSEIE